MENERVSCDVCGKTFAAKTDLEQHKRDAHGGGQKEKVKVSLKISKSLIITIAIVVAIGGGGAYLFLNPIAPSGGVDGILCQSMEQVAFHIHAHLDIFMDGQPYTVPGQIGIPGSCFYWLHTHDSTGVIHIEAPELVTFKLGQFLDIWSNSSVTSPPTGEPKAYVNGNPFSGDYRNIPLNAHDEIVLVYGTSLLSVPSSYDFPPGE